MPRSKHLLSAEDQQLKSQLQQALDALRAASDETGEIKNRRTPDIIHAAIQDISRFHAVKLNRMLGELGIRQSSVAGRGTNIHTIDLRIVTISPEMIRRLRGEGPPKKVRPAKTVKRTPPARKAKKPTPPQSVADPPAEEGQSVTNATAELARIIREKDEEIEEQTQVIEGLRERIVEIEREKDALRSRIGQLEAQTRIDPDALEILKREQQRGK